MKAAQEAKRVQSEVSWAQRSPRPSHSPAAALLDSPVWRALPSSGALPQEEASLREGRLQTLAFLSGTWLGVYPPVASADHVCRTQAHRASANSGMAASGKVEQAQLCNSSQDAWEGTPHSEQAFCKGFESLALHLPQARLAYSCHRSTSLSLGYRNFSFREAPTIGTKSELWGETLEPTRAHAPPRPQLPPSETHLARLPG